MGYSFFRNKEIARPYTKVLTRFSESAITACHRQIKGVQYKANNDPSSGTTQNYGDYIDKEDNDEKDTDPCRSRIPAMGITVREPPYLALVFRDVDRSSWHLDFKLVVKGSSCAWYCRLTKGLQSCNKTTIL